MGDTFRVEAQILEDTMGGLFGGPVDRERRFTPGLMRYLINNREVTKEEYERRIKTVTKEEKTSKRVAAIAGRVMKRIQTLKMKGDAQVGAESFVCYNLPTGLPIEVCTIAELEALAASTLTQAPDRTQRNPRGFDIAPRAKK